MAIGFMLALRGLAPDSVAYGYGEQSGVHGLSVSRDRMPNCVRDGAAIAEASKDSWPSFAAA
jgi:hypothetical protein